MHMIRVAIPTLILLGLSRHDDPDVCTVAFTEMNATVLQFHSQCFHRFVESAEMRHVFLALRPCFETCRMQAWLLKQVGRDESQTLLESIFDGNFLTDMCQSLAVLCMLCFEHL